MANIHDGHRERLRNKLRKYGFECLEDHEKLEYLLYPFIPRRDTNPIAHELISTFGSYRKVLEADAELLASVKGMTENAALFLHLLPDAFSAYLTSEKELRLTGTAQCAEYIIARIGRKKEEHMLALYIDESGKLIHSEDNSSDRRRSVVIDRDHLVATAVKCRAKYVVIGHNHPGEDLTPSGADIDASNRIVQALGMVGIKLGDSLIVSPTAYYSMKQQGDLVEAVNLNDSLSGFAESLIRRENEIHRLKINKADMD